MSRSYKKNKYTKSKQFDRTCRCHGSCSYCRENRLYFDKKNRLGSILDMQNDDYEFMNKKYNRRIDNG